MSSSAALVSSNEKNDVQYIEDTTSALPPLPPTDPVLERRLLLKLDRVIIPLTIILYLLAYLDRGNAGNAKLQGLETSLHLTDTEFSVVLACFYVAYIVFNIPGNVATKILLPSTSIAMGAMLWGIASSLQAATTSYAGIIVCRLFIGIGEAFFGPSVPLYYSYWYKRDEIAFRNALFIGMGALAGTFGGLIAFGVQHIHSSISTWRILFLIEGLPTILFAIAIFFVLPSSPEKSKYLTDSERELLLNRLSRDGLVDTGKFDWSGFRRAVTDYKVYLCGIIYLGVNITLASISGFLPTIIKNMGYTAAEAQLYTVPPYAVATFLTVATSWVSDKSRLRGPFVAGYMALSAIGFGILMGVQHNQHVRYFATFLVVSGAFTCIPLMLSWCSNNCGSQSQRAVEVAMMNGIGQCFAILASFIFPSSEGPEYRKGFGLNIAFNGLAAVTALALMFLVKRENERRDRIEGPLPKEDEGRVDTVGMHDLARGFRYVM
ncbi:MFS general substrate transporter [Saitoella complicata NRRL Y-17804]|uniref:Major facilitator superfamily (MFS) profile domain-containing protein n=1 Tax=Saitoella complicata (strain BCRC 22490 / CBS 7301 / JCM 7358 / NBRC 10748 / NRRL Y-17804) TaxID=698492 RepID=A0A0E9NGB3_SAICN|nr:MFS general substrate transporter [Saitoella complicata NRRL Y-17804]ODQ50949.1 MFS general substrate transporter [Saitoella complicata NRRL Y-17804]GAO48440.1 hypothetical protein G7K_2613-t1 [Saitoella complicata NRRL Y-17804]